MKKGVLLYVLLRDIFTQNRTFYVWDVIKLLVAFAGSFWVRLLKVRRRFMQIRWNVFTFCS